MKKKILSTILIFATLLQCIFISSAIAPTTDEIVYKAEEIICQKEGTYSSVVADDNGALSIGCLQWHATRALNLLKDIVKANPKNAKTILGEALYNEIQTATAWTTRVLTADEKTKMQTLLSTEESKAAQDALLHKDVLAYVNHGRELGLTSPTALVYFADVENQCGGGGSARVYKAAKELANGGEVTLEYLHQAALEDKAASISSNRRKSVYNYCKLLGWEDEIIAEAYEVWTVTADPSLNVRSGPDTSYGKVSSYTLGTQIMIFEKVTTGNIPWGRTSLGWVCLDYCEFVSRHEPSESIFSVKFDANGATLNDTILASLKISAINATRTTDTLVIYTDSYGSTTGTNMYGAEVVIGIDGIAQSTPQYGVSNSAIPSGGFVVSAHGTAEAKLRASIKKGDYVIYDEKTMTLEVYSDRQAYIAANKKAATGAAIGILPTVTKTGYTFNGWYDENGTKHEPSTVVTAEKELTLTAKWIPISVTVMFDTNGGNASEPAKPKAEKTADGINVYRFEDQLIIYDNQRGETTKTNRYGSEAAVNSAGIVTNVWPITSGAGDHPIPKDGFVISGHGKSDSWITSNISVGDRVVFDYETKKVSVYANEVNVSQSITATYGQPLGTLPTPQKEGFAFKGWFTENGKKYTEHTPSDFLKDTVLCAQWTELNSDSTDTEPAPGYIKGDVDGDGNVTAGDITWVILELKTLGSTGSANADVDKDGSITASDITALIAEMKKSLN